MKSKLPSAFVIVFLMSGLLFSSALAFQSNASSQTLYGCTSNKKGLSSLYTIDTTTGAATLVGSMNIIYGCSGLAFSGSGTLYATGQDGSSSGSPSLFTVNPATGAATLVGASQGSTCTNHITDIDFSQSGTLYATFETCLATINPNNGAVSDIGNINGATLYNAGNALAVSSSGTLYYATNTLYTLNPSTASVSTIAALSGYPSGCSFANGDVINALKFDSSATLYGIMNCYLTSYLVTVNTSTAVMTVIGATTSTMDGIAFAPAAAGSQGGAPPSLEQGNVTVYTPSDTAPYILVSVTASISQMHSGPFYESLSPQYGYISNNTWGYLGYYQGTFAAVSGGQQGLTVTINVTYNGTTLTGYLTSPSRGGVNSTSIVFGQPA